MTAHYIILLLVTLLAGYCKQLPDPSSQAAADVSLSVAQAMVNLDEDAMLALLDSRNVQNENCIRRLFSEHSFFHENMMELQKENPKLAVVCLGSTWPSVKNKSREDPDEKDASIESSCTDAVEYGELVDCDGNPASDQVEARPRQNVYEDKYYTAYTFTGDGIGILLDFKLVKLGDRWCFDTGFFNELAETGSVDIPKNLYQDETNPRPAKLERSPEQIFAEKAQKWNADIDLPEIKHGKLFTPCMYSENCIVVEVYKGRHPIAALYVNGKAATCGDLCDILMKVRRETGKEPEVFIRFDSTARHSDIARAINAATQVGVWKLQILGIEKANTDRPGALPASTKYSFLKVNRPDPATGLDGNRSIEICRGHNNAPCGTIFYDGNRLGEENDRSGKSTLEELDAHLAEAVKDSSQEPVFVICTEDSPHLTLVNVLDLCAKHGLAACVFTE